MARGMQESTKCLEGASVRSADEILTSIANGLLGEGGGWFTIWLDEGDSWHCEVETSRQLVSSEGETMDDAVNSLLDQIASIDLPNKTKWEGTSA